MANPVVREEVLNRLKTIKGHIAGVERMVDEEKPCADVLIQLSAIRSSVEKIGVFILENNAMECLCQDWQTSQESKEKVEQIVRQMLTFLK